MSGGFIVLEGLDGAGTTTQMSRLAALLTGEVVQTHEPTDGPVGRIIRQMLRSEEGAPDPYTLPWMFAADRADHLARLVLPALARGAWVVSDRYYLSSLAYHHQQPGIWDLNRHFEHPDLTILLEVPVDECMRRITARGGKRELFEHAKTLTSIKASYSRQAGLLRALNGSNIVSVGGMGTPEAVTERIWEHVAKLVHA